MLGPLPYFHRVAVVLAVLLTAVGSGAWIAHFTSLPVAWGAGAAGGTAGRPGRRLRTRPHRPRGAPCPRPPSLTPSTEHCHRPGPAMTERNVLGEALEPCGTEPLTGYYRDGDCRCGPEDQGLHAVCAVMTAGFLDHQRSVGNDLVTPRPEWGFPGARAWRPLVRRRRPLAAGLPRRRGRTRRARLDQRARAGGGAARGTGGVLGRRTRGRQHAGRRPVRDLRLSDNPFPQRSRRPSVARHIDGKVVS